MTRPQGESEKDEEADGDEEKHQPEHGFASGAEELTRGGRHRHIVPPARLERLVPTDLTSADE